MGDILDDMHMEQLFLFWALVLVWQLSETTKKTSLLQELFTTANVWCDVTYWLPLIGSRYLKIVYSVGTGIDGDSDGLMLHVHVSVL